MTTPPDKQPAVETLEETALRIASVPYPSYSQLSKRRKHADAILSALRNERERCQKIADKYVADMRSVTKRTGYGEGCLNAGVYIAKAIREGK